MSRHHNWFSRQWHLRKKPRNSTLVTCHYPDLCRASDWLKQLQALSRAAGSNSSWVWNFCPRSPDVILRGTNGGVTKYRLFAQAILFFFVFFRSNGRLLFTNCLQGILQFLRIIIIYIIITPASCSCKNWARWVASTRIWPMKSTGCVLSKGKASGTVCRALCRLKQFTCMFHCWFVRHLKKHTINVLKFEGIVCWYRACYILR